jgi:hypothetical protein
MFVEAVKAHAVDNYEADGWDIVVECYADDEIEMVIRNAADVEQAIALMLNWVKPQAQYRAEIVAEMF